MGETRGKKEGKLNYSSLNYGDSDVFFIYNFHIKVDLNR